MQACLPKYCVQRKVKAKVKRDENASQDCRVLSGRHCVRINVLGLPRREVKEKPRLQLDL